MRDSRNDPQNRPDSGKQPIEDKESNSNENPQEGVQWDNYQTRSLSSEGGEKIEESDLLRADEVNRQNPSNTSGGQG